MLKVSDCKIKDGPVLGLDRIWLSGFKSESIGLSQWVSGLMWMHTMWQSVTLSLTCLPASINDDDKPTLT